MWLFLLVVVYLSSDGADSGILSFLLFVSILWHLLSDILDLKVYYRNSNKNIFTVDIKPDETMKEVAAKIQDKGGLIPCHVSVTLVNNVCACGKRIQHLLLESLDNPKDIEIDSELEIDDAMEDSFTYINWL